MNCYRVKVETTNSSDDTCNVGGKYLPVEDGFAYVFANSMSAVEKLFGDQIIDITKLGIGYLSGKQEEKT